MEENLPALLFIIVPNPNLDIRCALVYAFPQSCPIGGITVFHHHLSGLRKYLQTVVRVIDHRLRVGEAAVPHNHVAAQIVKIGVAKSGSDGLLARIGIAVSDGAATLDVGGHVPDRIIPVIAGQPGERLDAVQIVIRDGHVA